MANERDFYYSELMTAVAGLTINSKSMSVVKSEAESRKTPNFIHVMVGDEANEWRTETTSVESDTSVEFEIIAHVGTSSSQDLIAVKNEAIAKLRKKLITYRKSTPKNTTTDDFKVVIKNLTYTGIFQAEDLKSNFIEILITGNLTINLWES